MRLLLLAARWLRFGAMSEAIGVLFILTTYGTNLPGADTASVSRQICPYMNSATAGGILGGPVTVTVTHPEKNKVDAICQFVRRSDPSSKLLIEVSSMTNPQAEFKSYLAQCRANSIPVRAIGNEAIACIAGGDEQIIGRVRDRAFIVRMSAGDQSKQKALDVAEQVAGNLF